MKADSAPQVSVVLATHGDSSHLDETLESVLTQRGVSLECLLVADGPMPAGILAKIRDWIRWDPRLRLIERCRAGLTQALIEGCQQARGSVIARIDVGDVMLSGRLASQWDLFARHPNCVLVSSDVEICGPCWEPISILRGVPHGEPPCRIDTLPPDQGLAGDVPHHGSVMMRRTAYASAGGYRSAFYYGQDWDLWYRLARLGTYAVVPHPLTRCRLFPAGISSQRWREQRRLSAISLGAYVARCQGAEEAPWLEKALRIRPPNHRTPWHHLAALRRLATAGDGAYFIGENLRRRGDPRSRRYLGLAIRQAPWRPRIWFRFLQALPLSSGDLD